MLLAVGAYARDIFGAGTEEYKLVLKASLLSAGLVGIGCYLTGFPLSRGFFLLAFTIGTPLLLGWRFVFRRSIQHTRRHGHLRQGVIIAGNPRHVDEVAAVLRRESWLGYTVLGALTSLEVPMVETPAGIPVLGSTTDAVAAIDGVSADVILFADGAFSSAHDLRRAMWALESHPVQCIVVPSLTDVSTERLKVRPVAGLPLVHVEAPRTLHASHWAKRTFDVLGSLGILLLISPIWLATAVAVKFHDGGPVLFRQTRIGRDGRPFSCLKFRSMVIEAEQLRADLEVNHERSAVLFKMADDPRVTRPGKLIRRLSIDELPQLWNVLRRPDEPGRPAPAAAARGGPLRLRHEPSPAGAPRHDRPVAGLRTLRPQLGRDRAPRPLLRRQLVDGPGPQHPGPHRLRRPQQPRRLLTEPAASPLVGEPARPVATPPAPLDHRLSDGAGDPRRPGDRLRGLDTLGRGRPHGSTPNLSR